MHEKDPNLPEIMLRAFWGAKLLWGLLAVVFVIIPLIGGGSLQNRISVSVVFLVLFGWIFISAAIQRFGVQGGYLIYIGYKFGFIPVRKEIPLTNLNQILFGQLNKVNKQASSLGWPLPKVTGGINLVKQFFLVLTNDHQTVAVPTQSYSRKGGEAFISALREAGITVEVID